MRLSGYFASYRVADFLMYAEIRLRQFSKLPQLFFYSFCKQGAAFHTLLPARLQRGHPPYLFSPRITLIAFYIYNSGVLRSRLKKIKKETTDEK